MGGLYQGPGKAEGKGTQEQESRPECFSVTSGEPAGWSEREAAVELRDKCNVSGGCLPSLTLNVRQMMSLLPWTRAYRAKKVAQESDFGRRFGWFIEKGVDRIGELDYVRWDSVTQFWHEYRLTWRRPEDAVVGPDAWIAAKLVLRNRRYTDVMIDLFLTSSERGGGIIAVRFASVSVERFEKDDTV